MSTGGVSSGRRTSGRRTEGQPKRPHASSARAFVCCFVAICLVSGSLVLFPRGAGASASDATQLVFTTEPGGASGGTAFSTQPVVTFENASNATVSTAATVTLTIKSGTGASGAVLTCKSQGASGGVATFAGCKINLAGTGYVLTATSGTLTGTSSSFSVTVGAASQVAFVTQPPSIQAGTDFASSPEVALEDAGGNIVTTNSTDSVGLAVVSGAGMGPLSCSGGETAAPATAPPAYGLTASSGTATFSRCTIDEASSNDYQLVAEATNNTTAGTFTVESAPFAVYAGPASKLAFTTNPTGAQAGEPFTTQPVVSFEDAYGNVVSSETGAVGLAITTGTGASGATLSCNANTTTNGVAAFTGCAITTVGSNYTLTATSGALSGVSAALDVSASGAANLAFGTEPGDGTGGAVLSQQPVVSVTDAGGNPVSGSVQLSLTGGTPGAQLSCPANNTVSAGTGTASFIGCSVNLAGTGYKLVATDPGTSLTVTSSPFDITVGPAAQVAFVTPPSGAEGGTAFTAQPEVAVEDLGGNPIAVSGGTVALSIASGTGSAGAQLTCSGDPSDTASISSGAVTFSGCAINSAGTGYELTATADGFVSESPAFSVATGSPSALQFSVQPSGGTVSSPLGSQPQVTVTDAGGNPVGATTATVTLTISSATLSCVANPVSTTTGVATFSGCEVPTAGSYTLTASAPTLASATSASFTIVNGTPLETAPVGTPLAQTFGGDTNYANNPTSVVDDVNSATGAVQVAYEDLQVAGIGVAFDLTRSYNSLDTTGGVFGPGWSSIFDAGVQVAANGLTATVRGEDGQQVVFKSNGAGGWIAPPGAHSKLVCSGATCTVTRFDGISFESVGGRIENYLSPGGEGLHFVYSGADLTEVTVQTSGAPLVIDVTENSSGEITQVQSPTRSVSYGYSGDILTSYTDADGNTWTYSYNSAQQLTQVIDPLSNVRLAVSYMSPGGRVSTADGMGSSQGLFSDTYAWNSTNQVSTRTALVETAGGLTAGNWVDQYKNNVLVSEQVPDGATTSYSYDGDLNLIEMQDPLGAIEQMTFDAAGDLTSQTQPYKGSATSITRFGYNSSHQLISETDADGNTTSYGYSGANLVKVTPPGSSSGATTFTYNSLGEKTKAVKPTGIETFSYDEYGNLTGFVLESSGGASLNGQGPNYTYNEAGEKLVSTDPRGNVSSGLKAAYQTTDTYDADGNLMSTTTPGPQTASTAYDAAEDVSSVTDAAGNTTSYSWDQATRTRTATGPSGVTTSVYDPSGDLVSQTTAGGQATSYTYDTSGRQLTESEPDGVTSTDTYDLDDNVLSATDTAGNTASYSYDADNRVISQTVNGQTTSYAYDPYGNKTSQTDPDGATTTYTYNSHEKMATATTAAGTTTYAYDLGDDLTSVTDPDGYRTTYVYNGAGEKTQMIIAGEVWTYSYDSAGNLVSTTDPDGRTTAYTLDAQGLRTKITYSQAGQTTIKVTETYNAAGERTAMTDPTTGTHTYTYDSGGDMTKAANGASDTYSYSYSVAGQMTETYPDGTKVTYTYDDDHNVMSVAVSGADPMKVSYVRNTDRQVTGIAYSNGLFETDAYNEAGELTGQTLTCADTTEMTTATSYDAAGNPLGQATTVGSSETITEDGYDGTERVDAQSASTGPAASATSPGACTSGTQSGSTPQQNNGSGSTTGGTPPTNANQPSNSAGSAPATGTSANPIHYDGDGNRITDDGTTYTYNSADELVSESGNVTASYAYDNAGDLTAKTVNGVTTSYAYNAADQLVTVTTGTTQVAYAYDGDGNRVSQSVTTPSGTTTTDYSWDISGNVPLLALVTTSGGSLIRRYIYGVGPVAMQTPAGTYYLTTDQRGDVNSISDDTGAILETYTYDAYGNVTATPVPGAVAAPANPLLFEGQYLDTVTGLYDMRARDYDPTTGLFTQKDPAVPSVGAPAVSPYIFAGDQPTVGSDPTGMTVSPLTPLEGHSSISVDVANDVKTAIGIYKGAKWAYGAYVTATEKTASADAAPAEDTASADAADGGSELAEDSALDVAADDGPELAETAGTASKVFGAGLAVVGLGLSLYVTVEDCEHGTVAQCVGDTVGLAFAVGCAVATSGGGLILCNLIGAGIGIAISEFGPQMVQGLSDLAQYGIEGATFAYEVIAQGFADAGVALEGAYGIVADTLSSAFSTASAVISSAFNTAVGTLSTGFNEAVSAISSGYDSAVATLEQAGYDALQMADVLKGYFQEGVDAVVNQLISLEYDVDGVASALEGAFDYAGQQAAALLQDFDYGVDQVSHALLDVYADAAELAGQILQGLSYTIGDITGALDSVYHETAAEAAAVLQDLNYTADQIAGELDSIYSETAKEVATILAGLNYGIDVVAGALEDAYSETAAEVTTIFNDLGDSAAEIASMLSSVYAETQGEIVQLLQSAGYTVDEAATAIENAFSEGAQAVAGVLESIGDTASQVEGVLENVFDEATSEVESILGDVGFSTADIDAIGGAFTSFGDDIASGFKKAFSWL